MIKGLLVIVGSMLLYASVASGAGPLIVAEHARTAGWLPYAHLLARIGPIVPASEPVGLLLLGCGFVLVSYQLRKKP